LPNFFKKISIILVSLLIIAASFVGGIFIGINQKPAIESVINIVRKTPEIPTPSQEQAKTDFNLFWDVWSRLEEKYVDKDKIDRKTLVFGAAEGLVKALDDPYSEFLPPAETKQFQEDVRGSFDGIGAEIGIRKGVLTIIAPLEDMPAEKAGLKAGDKILKVDDILTADLNLNEAVRLIRGQKGTEVRLLVLRDSFEQPKEFKVIRDTIRVKIISTAKKPDGVFVIKLNHFAETAAFDFRNAVEEFYKSGSKKLILDLRNNPGGFLNISIDIASWFLPAGEVVTRERYADGSEDTYRSSGYRLLADIPTVVLVNEGSASASEIVAGALRDIRGIKLVGAKTFGKGSVQEVIPIQGGSSLKVTIAKWLTPKGAEINGTGLEPDVKVEIPSDEELKEGEEVKDFILEKGIEVLKGL